MPSLFSDEAQLELGHVLFMDIVGYSKLLVDEQTNCARRLNTIVRNSTQFQTAEAADKLFRLPTGDGMVLVFFTSPETPVRCAMEIAEALRECSDFQLRMGVHSGAINKVSDINDHSNVAGNGINIAQRVMDCGDGGHILLSQRVAEDLSQYGRWRLLLHDLGEVEVKHGVKLNVVNLFSEQFGNAVPPQKFTRAKPAAKKQRVDSLAVKPFDNFSEDAGKGYFADGMTDELITKLTQISALKRVISRSTMMKYKQSPKSAPEIAAEVKVGAVLEGSVLVSGEYVRISAQLIEAQTDQTLWADSYTRTLSNVLQLQNDVALAIAQAIELKLTPAEKERLTDTATVNPQAYDYYLRGKNAYGTSGEDLLKRINMLEKAVFIDPTFAEAHAELSVAYTNKAYFLEAGTKPVEIKAEAMAEKALQLKPDLPAALVAQALLVWRPTSGFQHEESAELTCRALAVAPNMAEAHRHLGSVYFHVGLVAEALQQYRITVELNPEDALARFNAGYMEMLLGHHDEAIVMMEENATGMVRAFVEYNIVNAYFLAGREAEARDRLERSKAEFKDVGGILTAMQAFFLALDGDKTRAKEKIRESISIGEGFGHFHHTTHVIASAYASIDEPDEAMKWLDYTVENGYPSLWCIERDLNLGKLHQDSRFIDLLAKLRIRFQRFRALAGRCHGVATIDAPVPFV